MDIRDFKLTVLVVLVHSKEDLKSPTIGSNTQMSELIPVVMIMTHPVLILPYIAS